MKFRCLAEPAFVIVDAPTAYDAQCIAFAKYVRDMSPADITVEESLPGDPWEEKKS